MVKEITEYDGYTNYKVNVLDGGFIEIIHWVDKDRNNLTDEEIKQRKLNKESIYNIEITFRVAKQSMLSSSELSSLRNW